MNRRTVLKLAGLTAARASAALLPDHSLFNKDPEAFWQRVRADQFLMPAWRTYLNNGSLGVAPKPVVDAVSNYTARSAGLPVDGEYPRWGYETLDEYRTEYAEFVGCKKDELAFGHNATEAMSTIAAGLDLKEGDEVLITDQEHPSGKGPWMRRQARDRITVREVKLPIPPKNPEQLIDVVISAIGPRTRVLSFSGILTTTGLIMPVRAICDAASAKGCITVVDGAHMNGQIPTRLDDLGCDLFAGSPHKWLFAPPGCGLLYIREPMLEKLWPTTVTGNWDNYSLKAARFMMVGTNNRAVFEGLMEGLRFHKALGSQPIYDRIHQLAKSVYRRASQLPYVEMLTPPDERMYGGLVTFQVKDPAIDKRFRALCSHRRIWIYGGQHLRVATHIHTRPSDLDLLFEALAEAAA